MIGSYLRETLSRSLLPRRSPYRSVPSNDSNEQLKHVEESNRLSEAPKPRRGVWILTGLVLAIILFAAVFGSWYLIYGWNKKPESFVPLFKTHGVVFDLNDLFASPPSEESNAAWDSMIPDGHGYVLVPDAAERYGLKPGISTDEGAERYSVALYHQIHCLGVIRILFYEMVSFGNKTAASQKRQHEHSPSDDSSSDMENQSKTHHGHHGGEDDNQVQDPIPDHVEHCFDYLRQSLICAGDMTIEHAREPPLGEKRETTDGWGVEHQCKDWDEMVRWTLDHKAKHNLTGILG